MDFILSICDDTIMHMKFCHDNLGNILYELLTFGFENVIGFSSP